MKKYNKYTTKQNKMQINMDTQKVQTITSNENWYKDRK